MDCQFVTRRLNLADGESEDTAVYISVWLQCSLSALWDIVQPSEKSVSKNALTAILLYELSQLENLSATDQMRAASELSAAIQTIKIASKSDQSFFKNQVSFYKSVKDELSTSGSSNTRTTKFIVAGVMECICKSAEIDGLQDTLITSVKHWIRGSGRKI